LIVPVVSLANYLPRYSSDDRSREAGFRYDCASGNYGAFAESHAGQNYARCTDPYIVSDDNWTIFVALRSDFNATIFKKIASRNARLHQTISLKNR
jgi:hypothetical protein